jgi:hypothetical protein
VHGAAKKAGASADDVDATGDIACVTDHKVAGTIENAGATEKSDQ